MAAYTQAVVILVLMVLFSEMFVYYMYMYTKHPSTVVYQNGSQITHTPFPEDRKPHSETLCREHIYSFDSKSSTGSIFNDTLLWSECGINRPIIPEEAVLFELPRIRTKCSEVEGVLLSHKREVRKDRTGFLVPNIVHYVVFGPQPFTFLNYISFKSADKFLKPQFIFVHGDGLMNGVWWNKTRVEVPNIFLVYRPQVAFIQDKKPGSFAHQADVIRLQALQDNGGIYLDTDVVVLKTFDPLRRNFTMTMGRPSSVSLCNCIMLAAPRQPFMCVWYQGYRDYNPKRPGAWGHYSVITAHKLARMFPKQIHVEERSLLHPSWADGELPLLFEKVYDWSNNYAIHVWKSLRSAQVPKDPADIKHLNTTLGQIMRHVLSK